MKKTIVIVLSLLLAAVAIGALLFFDFEETDYERDI